jgi:hypothetical protein
MSEWHYRIGDQEYGPILEEELRSKIESGELSSGTYVFRNGLTNSLKAGRCKEFSSPAPSEKKGDRRKMRHAREFGRKFGSLFRRRLSLPPRKSGPQGPSRNRILFWCLGMMLVGLLAGVLLQAARRHPGSGFARYLLPSFQASDPSHPSLERTRNYWLALRKIEKPANESLKKLQLCDRDSRTFGPLAMARRRV